MNSRSTGILEAVAWAKFRAEVGATFETAGELFKAHPAGRIAWIAGKALKFISNGISIVRPLVGLFLLTDDVEAITQAAFPGAQQSASDAAQPRVANTDTPATDAPHVVGINSASTPQTSLLVGSLGTVGGYLEDDLIVSALQATSGDVSTSLIEQSTKWQQQMMTFLDQADQLKAPSQQDIDDLTSILLGFGELSGEMTLLQQSLMQLFSQVILERYDGPADPLYVAERNSSNRTIKQLSDRLTALATGVDEFIANTAASEFNPVVSIDDITVVSTATGSEFITKNTETFTLEARIRNLGDVPLDNLSAMLSLKSSQNAITANQSEVQIGDGSLAANDGVAGSGPDEATVTWTVQFNGSTAEREHSAFLLTVLESGSAPASFFASTQMAFLSLDYSLIDYDLDAIPDDYERANGLDSNRDDSGEDLDDDAASNIEEYLAGTVANLKDSDGDKLSDGEELSTGADGFITDPLSKDSDGDGVEDNLDGSPLDPLSSSPSAPMDEPQVSVGRTTVTLTSDEPFARVKVGNSGSGELNWSAASLNPAIASISPLDAPLRNGPGELLIGTPPDYDFAAASGVTTVVRVVDVLGAEKDFKDILVRIGNDPISTYNVVVSTEGGGTVTSEDGLINCGVDCSENYAMGSEIRLLTQPAAGRIIVGWSGHPDCTSQPMIVTANTSCVAVFGPKGLLFRNGFEQ